MPWLQGDKACGNFSFSPKDEINLNVKISKFVPEKHCKVNNNFGENYKCEK